MKSHYRVMLGCGNKPNEASFTGGFIGIDFDIAQDLTEKLPDDWRHFNKVVILGLREPEYALRDGFVQILWRPAQHAIPQAEAQEAQAEAQEAQATLTPTELILLTACTEGPALGQALLSAAGYRERTGNFKRSLERLLSEELLAMTLPDKPTSPNQKYRLTDKGQAWLDARRK